MRKASGVIRSGAKLPVDECTEVLLAGVMTLRMAESELMVELPPPVDTLSDIRGCGCALLLLVSSDSR